MNVANLQLEGLMMALASVNALLVEKGVLNTDDIDLALRRAEAAMRSEDRLHEDMSPSNRDAVCFPLRLLMLANRAPADAAAPGFFELARRVGESKRPYNDQL